MKITDLTVVTGQGRGSGEGGPVLPAVTRAFLKEEMAPPLEVCEVRENMGRIVVTGESIEAWVSARNREAGGRSASGQEDPGTADR